MRTGPILRVISLLLCVSVAFAPATGYTQNEPVTEQRAIAEIIGDLEKRLLELLITTNQDDPEKIKRLKTAIAYLRDKAISDNAADAATLLKDRRFGKALQIEKQVAGDLQEILKIFKKSFLREQLEEYLKFRQRIADLLGKQKGETAKGKELSEAANADQDAMKDAAHSQKELEGETSETAREMEAGMPQVPGAENVSQASGKMGKASKSMKSGQMGKAGQNQQGAEQDLKNALDELDQAIRDLQQMLQQQALAKLQELVRKMLDRQKVVSKRSESLEKQIAPNEKPAKEQVAASKTLGKEENKIEKMSDEALDLLKTDGTAPAFTEGMKMVKADLGDVGANLNKGQLTKRELEKQKDIENMLKNMLDALNQEQAQQAGDQPPQQGQPGGQPQQPPLVPLTAELQLMKMLQQGILKDTKKADKAGEEAKKLAENMQLGNREGNLKNIAGQIGRQVPPLRPIAGMMENAKNMLKSGQTGGKPQLVQKEIIDALDQLIKAIQQQQQQQQMAAGGSGASGGQPTTGATVSTAAERAWGYGPMSSGVSNRAWFTGLPEKQRKTIENAFRAGDVPPRYKYLIELYNKRLSEDK